MDAGDLRLVEMLCSQVQQSVDLSLGGIYERLAVLESPATLESIREAIAELRASLAPVIVEATIELEEPLEETSEETLEEAIEEGGEDGEVAAANLERLEDADAELAAAAAAIEEASTALEEATESADIAPARTHWLTRSISRER